MDRESLTGAARILAGPLYEADEQQAEETRDASSERPESSRER
jgi:hypothetical protein